MAQLDRVYALLSEINQAIVRIRDRDALLAEACRIAAEVGGFELCWIGLVEPDGDVRKAARAGVDVSILDGIVVSARDEPNGRGAVGTSIRENRAVVVEDAAGRRANGAVAPTAGRPRLPDGRRLSAPPGGPADRRLRPLLQPAGLFRRRGASASSRSWPATSPSPSTCSRPSGRRPSRWRPCANPSVASATSSTATPFRCGSSTWRRWATWPSTMPPSRRTATRARSSWG